MKYEEVCNTITSKVLPAQQPIDGETINIDIGEKIDHAKNISHSVFPVQDAWALRVRVFQAGSTRWQLAVS